MGNEYCLGCMEEVNGYPCPRCGYRPVMESSSYALRPGTILRGRYLVGKVLGQGGFGITYIGLDLHLQRKIAIKEYYPYGAVSRKEDTGAILWYSEATAQNAGTSGVEAFLKEARKMSKISHIPEVVQVYDMFQENNTAYICMNYILGNTLMARLKANGPLSWEEAKTIFLPVIGAMERVHQAGLIHRDLSPDNIMLQNDGSIRILDLGAAKDLQVNAGRSSMQVAKSGFSPLEQYMERGKSGSWTDVYAIAATMYYALTGKLPPSAMDRMDPDGDALRWDLPALQTLPEPALNALKRAMILRISERTQTMAEFAAELTAEPAPKPIPKPEPKLELKPERKPEPKQEPKPQPKPEPIPEQKIPMHKPKKKPVGIIAAVILAVVAVGIIYFKPMLNKENHEEPSKIQMTTVPTSEPAPTIESEIDTEPTTVATEPHIASPEDYINILLVGQDARYGEEERYADTTILLTLNKYEKTLSMTSVLRDTLVQRGGRFLGHSYGGGKINAMYHMGYTWGGVAGSMGVMNQILYDNFGIEVDHNFEIDFDAFMEIVDILGGVEIEINQAEADYLNEDDFWVYKNMKPGLVKMNGMVALSYVRMRGHHGSDIVRTEQQRKVITAVLDQLRTKSLDELQEIANKILPHMTTSMTNEEITDLLSIVLPMITELEITSSGTCPVAGTYSGDVADIYKNGTLQSFLRFDEQENKKIMRAITEGEIYE